MIQKMASGSVSTLPHGVKLDDTSFMKKGIPQIRSLGAALNDLRSPVPGLVRIIQARSLHLHGERQVVENILGRDAILSFLIGCQIPSQPVDENALRNRIMQIKAQSEHGGHRTCQDVPRTRTGHARVSRHIHKDAPVRKSDEGSTAFHDDHRIEFPGCPLEHMDAVRSYLRDVQSGQSGHLSRVWGEDRLIGPVL